MKSAITAAVFIGLTTPALAEGFATTDLTEVTVPDMIFAGRSFDVASEPERLTVVCTTCKDDRAMLDLHIGRQTDGTEERYRSGETTLATLEAQCQSRAPECTLEAVEVGGAVGWVTTYESAGRVGSTAVLFQDGDMLIMRPLGADAAAARKTIESGLARLAPQVVNR